MAFHPGIAYGVAVLTIASLACMGVRNRRLGWRKETTNGFLDILMAWAAAREENRQALRTLPRSMETYPAPASAENIDMASQLGALSVALSVGSGTTPVEPTVSADQSINEVIPQKL
jgi:hypothetical protein